MDMLPISGITSLQDDEFTGPLPNPSSNLSDMHTDSFCRNLKQFMDDVTCETKYLDNALKNLRRYYKEVKMCHQLGMEVPAGFRENDQWCHQLREFYTTQDLPVSDLSPLSSLDNPTLPLTAVPLEDSTKTSVDKQHLNPSNITNDASLAHISIFRCVDKPSTSLLSWVMFTEDIICASVGFRRVDTIKKYLSTLYQDTIALDKLPPDAVLDMGDLATIHKANRNTNPGPCPPQFANVIHMDIVFGPEISVENIQDGLLFTDRYSCMTYLYPLKNLSTDIVNQLEAFFAHLGLLPKRLIFGFDTKLIGGKARNFLNSLKIHVYATPANHQECNGLVECH
jgi:hypothetical protein